MIPEWAATGRIRVLLAGAGSEMHSRLAEAVPADDEIELIGPVGLPSEIFDAIASAKPRVVLLDLTVESTFAESAELIAEIREKSPDSKILVSSAITVNGMVRYLLSLGISGYVFENMDPRGLLVAIRTVASGGTVFSETILRR